MIAGGGMPMDAVVANFESGAAELLSPDAAIDHWDVVEGQGSLLYRGYEAVSLGLLHGSRPDVFVVCDQPGHREMLGAPGFHGPAAEETMELTTLLDRRTNRAIRCSGVSYNTAGMDEGAASAVMTQDTARLALSVADPIRRGPAFDRLVDACLG